MLWAVGTDLHIKKKVRGEGKVNKPTVKQINFARELAEQLGKEEEYDFLEITETWSREEVSDLIDSLLAFKEERKKVRRR